MEIALLGHMGRDEAVAERLQGHTLHVLGQWENPGLVEKAEASGGQFHTVEDIKDAEAIADIVKVVKPDMFLTNFDDSLAAGVVDAIKRQTPEVLIPCPDKQASRVEWDKFYLREILEDIAPAYNPVNFMAETPEEVAEAIDFFKDQNSLIVIKPRNLSGGKGVKVMGKHFDDYAYGYKYAALSVLGNKNQSGVEIQEKLEGHEFTLQLFTDGSTLVEPPATYDYPYRNDGDKGPGTGGMGAFTMQAGEQLPFITEGDYRESIELMKQVLDTLKERGHDYKGVLYPTFFKTSEGLKMVEINARGGDPELINILDLMEDDVNFVEVLEQIAQGELTADSVRYKKLASAMIYLVSKEYGHRQGGPSDNFTLNVQAARESGANVRFAAAERIKENRYRSVSSSRVVGLSALGETPWDARQKIIQAIEAGFEHPLPLQYRRQIAEEKYIRGLAGDN